MSQWAYWGQEWALFEKVSFDGTNKIIRVNEDVVDLNIRNDVYSAWVRWVSREENFRFLPAIRYTGFDTIPGGFSGDNYFMTNGWKLLLDITKVKVDGVLYSDDYDTAYYTYSGSAVYPAKVSALFSVIAPTISVDGIDIPTAAENANAVWNNSTRTLTSHPSVVFPTASEIREEIESNQTTLATKAKQDEILSEITGLSGQTGGLTVSQANMLLEMYELLGLDPSKPLIVTASNRSAGTISQTILTDANSTIVTRN